MINENNTIFTWIICGAILISLWSNIDKSLPEIDRQALYAVQLCKDNGGIHSTSFDAFDITLVCKNSAEFKYRISYVPNNKP